MKRRSVICAAGLGLIASGPAQAQQAAPRLWRIGILTANPAAFMADRVDAMRGALRDMGYQEGRHYVFDFRSSGGSDDKLAELAADLVRQNVDMIITHGLAPMVVKRATTSIPVVVTDSGDLVAMGVVDSLARPGGNITGQVFFVDEIAAKRIELLKEALPGLSQVGLLYVGSALAQTRPEALLQRARQLKLAAPLFEVAPGTTDFAPAFAAMARQRVSAVTFHDHPTISSAARAIAEQAQRHRIAAAGSPLFAEAGGMLGYGVRFPDLWASAAVFVAKIFRGARPADLPIEQPTRFDTVVNLRVARQIGAKIPQSFLVRADKVIE